MTSGSGAAPCHSDCARCWGAQGQLSRGNRASWSRVRDLVERKNCSWHTARRLVLRVDSPLAQTCLHSNQLGRRGSNNPKTAQTMPAAQLLRGAAQPRCCRARAAAAAAHATPQPSQHARLAAAAAAASCSAPSRASAATADVDSEDDVELWTRQAFPLYLQSLDISAPPSPASSTDSIDGGRDGLWRAICREAKREAAREPLLSSFLYASVLAHSTFEASLSFVLAERLRSEVLLPTQLFDTFAEVLATNLNVSEGTLADIEACVARDPACTSPAMALLYYKGFHALATHRISNALWRRGQTVLALALQSRLSEVLGVDIHPAACFGRGVFLDHACGVVIGETAVIGNNVTLMQNVTLGGTGKESGDRHPKVGDNVLIGADSTVLGNIRIGDGALVAPGSLVLKPVPCNAMVAGSPAQQVGVRQVVAVQEEEEEEASAEAASAADGGMI